MPPTIGGLGIAEIIAIAGLLLTIITIGGTCVVWIIRLEGRVNTLQAELVATRQAFGERVLEMKDTHEQLRGDISYIRGRLDQVLSGWNQQRAARGTA